MYIEASSKNQTQQLVDEFDNILITYLKQHHKDIALNKQITKQQTFNQPQEEEEADYSDLVQKREEKESGGCNLI